MRREKAQGVSQNRKRRPRAAKAAQGPRRSWAAKASPPERRAKKRTARRWGRGTAASGTPAARWPKPQAVIQALWSR